MTDERRVALVTGGTRGIGLGIARALAAEAWDLAICGVRAGPEVQAVTQDLGQRGARVAYVRADVSVAGDRAALLESVRARYGRLDALVNNAGVAPAVRSDILEADEAGFERLVRVNLQGPYFLTQAAARWMVERRRADPSARLAIVFITSVSADVASANRGDYCVSKAGLSMAARLWAARLAEFDIPVYEVRPGIIDTDMTAGVHDRYDALIAGGLLPQARWGTPDDVGRAVAMLLRGDLPYSTGAVIPVDGGQTLPRL